MKTDLNSVIPGIRHYDISFIINSHTVGSSELPVLGSLAAQELGNFTGVREHFCFLNKEYLGAAEIGLYHQQSVVVEVGNNGLTREIFSDKYLGFFHSYLVILGETNTTGRIEMFPHLSVETIFGQILSIRTEELKSRQ